MYEFRLVQYHRGKFCYQDHHIFFLHKAIDLNFLLSRGSSVANSRNSQKLLKQRKMCYKDIGIVYGTHKQLGISRFWHQQLKSVRKQKYSELCGLHGLEFASLNIICLFFFSPWKLGFPLSEKIMDQYLPQMRNSANEDTADTDSGTSAIEKRIFSTETLLEVGDHLM